MLVACFSSLNKVFHRANYFSFDKVIYQFFLLWIVFLVVITSKNFLSSPIS